MEALEDGRTPYEIVTAIKAYSGDIDAIISIFREMESLLALNNDFNRLYFVWFERMLDALERKKSISAITNIPKANRGKTGRGMPKDILLDYRNRIIFCLVYYQRHALTEGGAIDEVQRFIVGSDDDEEYSPVFVSNIYRKEYSRYLPFAKKRLESYLSENNLNESDSIDELVEEFKESWGEFLYLKSLLEAHSW